tara:strand:- start:902 stop:1981 length:1080 start_codon:yes stop_codon:yes gene_type:complete
MNAPSHYDIADIKDRVKIWNVLHHFGHDCPETCKAIKSPLRDERHPSFSIFADGAMAKDHSTDDSFDVIGLYQTLAGCNTHEAIVGCGKLAGLAPSDLPPHLSVPPAPRSRIPSREEAPSRMKESLGEYTDDRAEEMREEAKLSLRREGGILRDFLRRKSLSESFAASMIEAGVIGVLKDKALREPAIAWMFENSHFGKGCKLRLAADSSRKTVWWHGKAQEHLFGEQLIMHGSHCAAIITEGESDTLALLQLGIPALGVTGAGILPNPKIVHFCCSYKDLGVWMDNDEAGRKATVKLQEHVATHASGSTVHEGVGSRVPEGMDIGDCLCKWGDKFSRYALRELDSLKVKHKPSKPHTT